jgi:hypothetical protein
MTATTILVDLWSAVTSHLAIDLWLIGAPQWFAVVLGVVLTSAVGAIMARLRLNKSATPGDRERVNIEYRGADGKVLDFGLFVKAIIRNGHGRPAELCQGAFCGCDPNVFGVGAMCVVSVQDGIIKENLTVQLDLGKKSLFVQSRFNQEQLLAALIGASPVEKLK